jgi:hypothetical protein
MSDLAFLRDSTRIVQDFLTTAIVVDDQAFLFAEEAQDESFRHKQPLIVPARQAVDKPTPALTTSSGNSSHDKVDETESQRKESRISAQDQTLNGKLLIDRFGEFGVVCSVIRPHKTELKKLHETLKRFAPIADVFVLDWVLYGDVTGENTKALIRTLVSDLETDGDGRIRLIVVYTGETDLEQVTEEVKKGLDWFKGEIKKERFSVILPGTGTRIVVYGKDGTIRVEDAAKRSITVDQLPDTVVREFAEISRGLLPNAVMASITAIRRNAHQLLSRFPSSLDPAFVTQSILICPEKASEQIVPLIASEIASILEDARIGELIEAKHLREWLDHRIESKLCNPPTNSRVTREEYKAGFEKMIEDGASKEKLKVLAEQHANFRNEIVPGDRKKVAKAITARLASTTIESTGDAKLAMLMSLRHRYEGAKPQLSLGAVVANTHPKNGVEVTDYWVCLQPVCDSVRLKSNRSFPFVPLNLVDDTNEHVIVVEEGGDVRYLQGKYNPYLIEMIEFAPGQNEQVFAENLGGRPTFTSMDGRNFTWIAELRPAHAQRIAHRVAVEVGRIGLVESEWGRIK